MSLKVLGTGMPRTGTSSLKTALEILGYGNCAHMEGLFGNARKTTQWVELFERGTTNFKDLFNGYQSSTDFPGCLLYEKLLAAYPDLKIIHGSRDPEAWYESMLTTVYAAVPHTEADREANRKKGEGSPKFRTIGAALSLVDVYLFQQYFRGEFLHKEKTLARYTAFQDEVRTRVPAHQLLEFNVREGWAPLCAFLEVPVPETEFPFRNKRKDFQEQIGKMLASGEKVTII